MGGAVRLDWWKRLGVYAGLACIGAALIGVSASPASAQQVVQKVFPQVACTSTAGNQNIDIAVSLAAPDEVVQGQNFTVEFPGGDAELPSAAAGFIVTQYQNLGTTYQIKGPAGTQFVAGSGVAEGSAQLNGVDINPPETGTVTDPDKFKIADPGPFAPGTLHRPKWTVTATAPAGTAGQSITLNAFILTTTVRLQGLLFPVAASCNIPQEVLVTIPIVAEGSTTTTAPETSSTTTTTTEPPTTTTTEEPPTSTTTTTEPEPTTTTTGGGGPTSSTSSTTAPTTTTSTSTTTTSTTTTTTVPPPTSTTSTTKSTTTTSTSTSTTSTSTSTTSTSTTTTLPPTTTTAPVEPEPVTGS